MAMFDVIIVAYWVSVCIGISGIMLSAIHFTVFKSPPKYKLAIGILSSRDHFIQRDAIRSTWLSALGDNNLSNEVFYAFVVTNKDCGIPVEYRISEYSCEEQNEWKEDDDLENIQFWRDGQGCDVAHYAPEYLTVAIDFQTIFGVIITGFALPVGATNGTSVQLWDLASDILVVEAKLEGEKTDDCWRTKDVHPHMLPKGFVGSLVVTCQDEMSCIGVKEWKTNLGYMPAVQFNPVLRFTSAVGEHVLPMNHDDLLLPALMMLKIADVSLVKQHIENEKSAYERRNQELREIDEKLEREINKHNDIIILPDVNGEYLEEVYRNLPRKLVSFHRWCNNNIKAEYVMKTDDDAYIDVKKVSLALKEVERRHVGGDWVWWGSFRRLWNVDRWGKWAEHSYSAPVYPDHACGAGNVISAGLSRWLVENRNNLHYYQGEDISAGIWFSALNVQHIDDDRWLCDNKCDPDMLASAQHLPPDFWRLWCNRNQCGDPCFCT